VFIEAKDDGSGGDNWSFTTTKLQSNRHHQQTNTQFFTGGMFFLSPNQQCQNTEGNLKYVQSEVYTCQYFVKQE